MAKFIPDSDADNFFGTSSGSTSTVQKTGGRFISDEEADSFFGPQTTPNFGVQPIPLEQAVSQQPKEPGFLSNLVNDPFKTLIAQPAVKFGQAIGGGIVNMFGDEAAKQRFAQETQKDTVMPGVFGDINIQGQKTFDQGGAMQIGGEALKSAAYLMPLERAGGIASQLATGQVGKGILSGGTQNLISGGMYGGGQAMAEGAPLGDILKEAGQAALIVGATGGVISGAVPAVIGAANKVSSSLPKILSYTSDTPEAAFTNLLQNRAKVAPLIGKVDEVQALETTRNAVRGLRKTLTQEWQEGTESIIQEFTGQRVDLSGKLGKMLDNVADDFGLVNIPQNIKNVSVKESLELLKEINSLPKAVLTFSPKGAQVRALQDILKAKVVKTFGGEKGSVANLYKNYSIKKGVFDAANDIVSAYNKNKPIKDVTAMNRLQKIFDENKGAYLNAILDLEKVTGVDVLSTITASKFNKIMPSTRNAVTSQTPFTKLINLLAFPLTSPRVASFITRRLPTDIPVRLAESVGAGSISRDINKIIETHKMNPNKQGGFAKNPFVSSGDDLAREAKKYKSAEEFVKTTPKTIRVWNKSKFSNDGAYADIPVTKKVDNITLYQGGKVGDGRQFWTSDKKYASQFGEVKEKTGSFYKVDNGNRVTDVYVEAPTKSQLTDIWNKANTGVMDKVKNSLGANIPNKQGGGY